MKKLIKSGNNPTYSAMIVGLPDPTDRKYSFIYYSEHILADNKFYYNISTNAVQRRDYTKAGDCLLNVEVVLASQKLPRCSFFVYEEIFDFNKDYPSYWNF